MDSATHAPSARPAAGGPQDQIRGGATSDDRPALVRFGDRLFAIYRGVDDPGIFYTTTTDGVSWTGVEGRTGGQPNLPGADGHRLDLG